MAADDLLLQGGTRLLHIGPHKTGTSAIQGALHLARERLATHGVVYPGRGRQTLWPILAVTGQPALLGEPKPDIAHWDLLVRAVSAAADKRVVISSEFFAEASDATASRVIADLGGEQVHVVTTLRPLSRILPSQWQQYVQNGFRLSYDEWLAGILRHPPRTPTPGFWRRHRHDDLIDRWASAAGAGNLTVVVVDESDPLMLLRVFESMLGLPHGFLEPAADAANRSLTLAEAEVVRMLNQEFKHRGWPDSSYPRFMRYGAIFQMKTGRQPAPDEPRIVTPAWALERAADIGAEMAANIRALGVRVVGDLSTLGQRPADPAREAAAGAARAYPAIPSQPAAGAHARVALLTTGVASEPLPGEAGVSAAPMAAAPVYLAPATSASAPRGAPAPEAGPAESLLPAEAAVHAVLGALVAGGVAMQGAADKLRDVDARTMARVLAQRLRRRLLTKLRLSRQA
ncbi:MAG TPA: hypothetical protein VMR00_07440 [Streptosporangiaceae bacterium]|jgi:hypothetical protein|nr:hypothetical protein [Streptosporangiaceae bacterium]